MAKYNAAQIIEALKGSGGVISVAADRVQVKGELHSKGKICASCEGTFVAVKPGHPAYHRW